MLHIAFPRHGAILNRHDGKETPDALEIAVTGTADPCDVVTVNGAPARQDGTSFRAAVRLTQKANEIVAESHGRNGDMRRSVQVLWDKASFRRYRFFIDDHIFFLEDISKNGYASIFDCFYLKHLRDVHQKYGTKFALNCFFRNDHGQFDLSEFPEKYRPEFEDNADWLSLSFHAYSEFPNRPYQYASPEKLAADFDFVREHLVRIAGEKTFSPPIVVHWGMLSPNCFPVLTERGVRVLSGGFLRGRTGNAPDSLQQGIFDIGYSLDPERSLYLVDHAALHDFDRGVTFHKGDTCCNRDPIEAVEKKVEARASNPIFSEVLGLGSHEQYSFPFYKNYIPDHFERIETAARLATEKGYKPVFAHEGLLGNTAWE